MLEPLLDFVALLRKNGVPASPAEVLDSLRAIELTGAADPLQVRAALAATLAKRPGDTQILDELFDLYFLRRSDVGSLASLPLFDALRARGFSDDELEAVRAVLQDEATRLGLAARTALGLRHGSIEGLMRLSGVTLDLGRIPTSLQIGFYAQQLLGKLGINAAEGELGRLRQRLLRALGEQRSLELADVIDAHLIKLRQEVRRFVADEFERRERAWREAARELVLADKSFSAINDAELQALTEEVRRLARKLKDMAALRPRLHKRGRLDARRTLRRSMMTGGVPFNLQYRKKRVEKPRLVILCDISDSVRNVSRFMLEFAYVLQSQFSQVRSFVFVSEVGETTDLFSEKEIGQAIQAAYGGAVVNVLGNSNYGRVLNSFRERFLDAVTTRTTVIIIGDARSNYYPPEPAALAAIRSRARRLFWLNPEPPASWALSDSAMRLYEPHCDRIMVVDNLASLSRAVDELVP